MIRSLIAVLMVTAAFAGAAQATPARQQQKAFSDATKQKLVAACVAEQGQQGPAASTSAEISSAMCVCLFDSEQAKPVSFTETEWLGVAAAIGGQHEALAKMTLETRERVANYAASYLFKMDPSQLGQCATARIVPPEVMKAAREQEEQARREMQKQRQTAPVQPVR